MLNTAIIGITGYGREHMRLLMHGHERGLMRPCAAVVINPEEAGEALDRLAALDCRIYDSVEKMWEQESGEIDLCMIPSSISTHYPFSRMALEHGSHVFVEKPVCGTVQEVREIVELADERELQVCVGFQDLYSVQTLEVKRRLLAGEFGKPLHLRGWGSWPRPLAYFSRNAWAGRLKNDNGWILDSPVNNAMAHFLMVLLYWGGASEETFATPTLLEGELYRAQSIPSFDTATFRLQTEEGPDLAYAVTHSGEKPVQPFLQVECENGLIEWTHCDRIRFQTPDGVSEETCVHIDPLRERMIEEVCRHVNGEPAQVCLARHASLHTRIVNALHDACPIHTFPEESLRSRERNGDAFHFVPGLVDELEQAFRQGKLLSEIRGPAQPAQAPFALQTYSGFSGSPPLSTAQVS